MTGTPDGRRLRSERTRTAVVGALLELIREGDLRPTAERIAARAGVSERTVFQHYKDREAMFTAMGELQAQAITEIWKPLSREGPYAERLDAFLEQRVRLLEFITPTRRAVLLEEPGSDAAAAGLARIRRLMRREVELVFAPEIGGADGKAAAAYAVAGWSFWNNLRSHQDLSEAEAEAAVRLALDAVLSG
jgi:TetR/AcrR family transcriptional regulator, regulator of autoinduction and epiphytic fitness